MQKLRYVLAIIFGLWAASMLSAQPPQAPNPPQSLLMEQRVAELEVQVAALKSRLEAFERYQASLVTKSAPNAPQGQLMSNAGIPAGRPVPYDNPFLMQPAAYPAQAAQPFVGGWVPQASPMAPFVQYGPQPMFRGGMGFGGGMMFGGGCGPNGCGVGMGRCGPGGCK